MPKSPRLVIRITEPEQQRLEAAATAAGVNVSTYVRSKIFDDQSVRTKPIGSESVRTEKVILADQATHVLKPSTKLVPLKPLSDPSKRDYSAAYQ